MNTQIPTIDIHSNATNAKTEEPTLLTKAEVARLIRKSTRTVEHWVKAGYLSCIRISHSVLFDRDQVLIDLKRFEAGGSNSSHRDISPL